MNNNHHINWFYLSSISGWIFIILYCLFTSISSVWVSMSFSEIKGTTLTFFTLLVAQIIFLIFSFIKKQKTIGFIMENKLMVFWLNILTLFSWLLMFMALQRIEASVESAIYQGWVPIVVMLLGLFKGNNGWLQVMGPLLIATSIFALIVARLYFNKDLHYNNTKMVLDGVILASIAGCTGGIYIFLSAKIMKVIGVTTLHVLTTRFVILLLVTSALAQEQLFTIVATDLYTLSKLVFLSIVFVVIPVYLLQHAILKLGAARVSIITPLVPVVALATEYIVAPWGNVWVPILIGLVSISLIISNILMKFKA
ncbi:EamA family transporter [Providencia manganoxydans]|uniref:EamA family transporter n=1 Tax=Providencia manganoxydans TaxID=2923283 RepID=UPI0032DB3640